MLREIVTPHNNPRIVASQLTTASSVGTAVIGPDDYSAIAGTAGQPTATLKQPFSRTGFLAVTAGTGVLAGGFGAIATVQNATTLVPAFNNASGTSVDATGEVLCLGFNSSVTTLCMNQRVLSTKTRQRIIWGKITGSSAAVTIGAPDFSVSRSATGVYRVTFKRPFARTPVVLVTGVASAGTTRAPVVGAKTAETVAITVANQAGAASDSDFYIMVIGQDTSDMQGGRYDVVLNSQRKPRMLGARVALSAGTPSISVGTEDFSGVSDDGSGLFTLTLRTPFKREFCTVGAARSNRFQVVSGTASTVQVNTLAAGGGSADPTSFDVIILGSDDVAVY